MSDFTANTAIPEQGQIQRCSLIRDDQVLRWSEVISLWQTDRAFRTFFVSLLANAPFPAYFWETPPLTRSTINDDFEFVLVNSPQLAGVRAHERAFADHFTAADPGTLAIEFPNLGGDAMLVAPCPDGPPAAYSQISVFSRNAPGDQQHEFWQRVGGALENRLSDQPVWVNTSGLGVYWLHVRLDNYPKYYTYAPYRDWQTN